MAQGQYAPHYQAGRREYSVGFVELIAIITICLQYSYVFIFNHSPEILRTIIAAILVAIHFSMASYAVARKGQPWQMMIMTTIAILVVSWLVAHGTHTTTTELTIAEAFRNIVIFVMPLWILAFPEYLPHRLLASLACFSIILGGLIALSGTPVMVGGTPRLGSITGGPTQMHPSAKFIALQLILVHQYVLAKMLSWKIGVPILLFAAYVMIGYAGRNEMLFVVTYFLALLYFRYRKISTVNWAPLVIFPLLIIFAGLALHFGDRTEAWGSGRIGVWTHRLELIWSRDFLTFLFGGGLGADQIWNPEWWWMEDALAHNDFLHIVMETGLFGLLAVILFLFALLSRLPGDAKSLVIALVTESMFSNGQFQSPLLALNFFLLVSTSIFCWQVRTARKHIRREERSPEPGAAPAVKT